MSKLSISGIKDGFGILLNGIVFCFILVTGLAGFFQPTDIWVYDLVLNNKLAHAPLSMSPRIKPIDLNDRAERNLGERLDSREAFADIFEFLGEADVVGGMDFLFPRFRNSGTDQRMAKNAGMMKRLVLAVVPMDPDKTRFSGNQLSEEELGILRRHLWYPIVKKQGAIPEAVTFLVSNLNLIDNAAALGHIGMESDQDGIFRRTPLFFRWEDGYIPSLPLAMAAIHEGIDSSSIVIDAGNEIILPFPDGRLVKIPVDKSGNAWIPYPARWGSSWDRVPLDTVSDAVQDIDTMYDLMNEFYNTIVIVADTTSGKKDFGVTPFETTYPLSGIHDSILNGILTGQFFKSTPVPVCFVILSISFVFVCLAFYRKNDIAFHLTYFIALCTHIAFISILWFAFRMVPWFAVSCFAVFGSWLVVFSLRLLKARENRLLLTEAMSRYFPRSLAEKILAEHKTDLVPSNKEISILFADIRGFTNWSSDKEAETVHAFLSDYLESMASIIFECGGTVDKFLGDGILAFFGDPYEQPDHTDRCLRAARAMQQKARELAAKWKPLVNIDLKIRIGINTGQVVVGNLGTKTRIEYTVIGAAVNLAQRMESNAPVGGILVAPDAKLKASGEFTFSKPVAVQVKGYEEPIEAFVLDL